MLALQLGALGSQSREVSQVSVSVLILSPSFHPWAQCKMVPKTKCVNYCLVPAETPLQYAGRAYLSETEVFGMMLKLWPEPWAISCSEHSLLRPKEHPAPAWKLDTCLAEWAELYLKFTWKAKEFKQACFGLVKPLTELLFFSILVFSSGSLLLTHLSMAGQQTASLPSSCQIITHVAKALTKCQLSFKSFIVKKKKKNPTTGYWIAVNDLERKVWNPAQQT